MSPSCQKCHFVVSPCHFLPYRFTAKELDEETGLYYYGARYLDPKYSRWLSTDPALGEYIPKAPIDEEAKKYNQNLPGMGGVFNHINGNLYAYGANNPIRYIDPDGRTLEIEYGEYGIFRSIVEKYIDEASAVSSEFKKIIDEIKNNPDVVVRIIEGKRNEAEKTDIEKFENNEPSGTLITFNPFLSDTDEYDDTIFYPTSSLVHELAHAYLNMQGKYYKDSAVYMSYGNFKMYLFNKTTETFAVDIENSVRVPMKHMEYRKSYSGYVLPIKPESTWKKQ